ncbi:MAG: hypothetical protein Q8Q09_21830 [Deltaproteobacteria bacterium]|nr:hypothetical protein [Deltaproteobacteria bacterium]
MDKLGGLLKTLLFLLLLCAGGLSAYNVMSDMTPIVKRARLVLACPSEAACALSRWDRRPWEQRLEFYLRGEGRVVVCRPIYVLAGEHTCSVTTETAAAPQFAR